MKLKRHLFVPSLERVGMVGNGVLSIEEIMDEPMFFSSSPGFVDKEGGPLSKRIMEQLYDLRSSWERRRPDLHPIIDTRVQMLMPGWYPAIPGWHCDAVVRSDDYKGQPDLERMDLQAPHYVVTLSTHKAGVSNTEFVTTATKIPYNPEKVWGSVNVAVDQQLGKGQINTMRARDGEIFEFDQNTLHRATPAHNRGWRLFFRLSFMYGPAQDEIRRQVQVYADPNVGW